MMLDEGLSKFTVKKADLLEILKNNQTQHVLDYREAMKGYREEAIRQYSKALDEAHSGQPIRTHFDLDEPEDHTKDYGRAIRMLEMNVKTEIVITESEFARYVEDDWGWKSKFVGTMNAYSEGARRNR